jgi:hypothetical protein
MQLVVRRKLKGRYQRPFELQTDEQLSGPSAYPESCDARRAHSGIALGQENSRENRRRDDRGART